MKSVTVFFLILLFSATVVEAKKIYKYQDENGKWHFTDEKPDTEQAVESQQVDVMQRKDLLSIINRGTKARPILYAVNRTFGPMDVTLRITGSNIKTTPASRILRILVEGNSTKRLAVIEADKNHYPWQYRYSVDYALGDPNAQVDMEYGYALPFPADQEFSISQGFNGEYSHQDFYSRYAVDIAMPEGTPILAARSGIVMDTEEDFYKSGIDKQKYIAMANTVRIIHDDGSMAVYAHLQLESLQVHPGQQVEVGDILAASGNTGYSSGPHLHFVIHRNSDNKTVSIPFNFYSSASGHFTPKAGMLLSNTKNVKQYGATASPASKIFQNFTRLLNEIKADN